MAQDRILIGVFTFFAFIIIARWIFETGLRRLTPDQKAAVLDSQSGIRKYSLIVALPVVGTAFYLPSFAPWLILAYVIGLLGVSYQRLMACSLPPSFQRTFLSYSALYLAGAVSLFGTIYIREWPW
jgi:hypothetical protein